MAALCNSPASQRALFFSSSATSHQLASRAPGVGIAGTRNGVPFRIRAHTSPGQDKHGRRGALALGVIATTASLSHAYSASFAAENTKGFQAVLDKKDGYSFVYPFGWQEVVIQGQDKVFKDVIEPLESASINIIPTTKQDIRDLGSPQEVAEVLIKKVLAPSSQKTKLIEASEHDVDGKAYYTFEFIAQAPNFTRHALGAISVGNGKFYTLTTGANERRWEKMKDRLHTIVDSFKGRRHRRHHQRRRSLRMGSYKYCLCFTRRFRWNEAEPPADVRAAFDAFAEGGASMSPEQLRRFLAESQGDAAATAGDAEKAIDQLRQLRHRLVKLNRPGMSLDDFHHFLFSEELNPPILSQVHQDMTAPLSHYYIFTGHNSYLTGNQLSSDCSDVPIVKALQRGVRVIELDMWPNATKDNIDILHGRTLTTPVELIKCLKSIKEHAFTASPYPVVITLEDHLTPDLQAKVAKMVIQTFGDMLYYPESDTLEEFPSPEALKKRIILSTKPPKEYLEAKDKESGSLNENVPKEEEAWGKEVPDLKIEIEADEKCENDQSEDEEDDADTIRQNASPEYKRLITIRAGKPKGDLVDFLKVDPDTVRRLSLSEHELAKAALSLGPNLVRFTQKNLLRIYPKGTRLNSSNYNPFVGWIHGAQMVAFNMQGYGRALWLMHGFFEANGGCGYVKKPDFLLNGFHGGTFNPKASLPVKRTLKVKVYMGDGWRLDFKQTYFDAYSPPDFYTRVGIAGVPADTVMKRTKAIEDDWTPVWNEEFTFPLTVPEIALLRIEVHEYDLSEKDDFGGQTCLPISELRPGIRAVPLFDRKGMKFKSVKLLMRFEFI